MLLPFVHSPLCCHCLADVCGCQGLLWFERVPQGLVYWQDGPQRDDVKTSMEPKGRGGQCPHQGLVQFSWDPGQLPQVWVVLTPAHPIHLPLVHGDIPVCLSCDVVRGNFSPGSEQMVRPDL